MIHDTPAGRLLLVAQGDPRADDANPGTHDAPLRTISAAARIARPGDTVRVRAGVYRERVAPPRGGEAGAPITYEGAPGERAVVRGSEVWAPSWERGAGGGPILRAALDPALFPPDFHPFRVPLRRAPVALHLGQVFCDGEPLAEVADAAALARTPGAFLVADAEASALLVHPPAGVRDPEAHRWEITVRDRLFAPHLRGLGHITLRGLAFEHCANQFPSGFWHKEPGAGAPQAGAVGTRSGHHWRIEGCTVRHARSIGIDCGSEGGRDVEGTEQPMPEEVGWHVIEGCVVSDNGCCGVAGWRHTGTRITGCVVERNNNLGHTAPETGGIKVHGFLDGVIEGCLLRDNDCFGIWLDNVYYGSRVSRNVCVNNQGAGIFVEMGDGPALIDHNVCAHTRQGEGIYAHDASGATYAHNLLYANAHFGLYCRTVTERTVERHDGERVPVATERNRIVGNVFVDNQRGPVCLPLPGEGAGGNECDHNLYVGGTQWHWEGLGRHPFVLNVRQGRRSPEHVAEALRAAFDAAGVPEGRRPNLALWAEQPYLTPEWWRLLTGWDAHSVFPAVKGGEVENGAVEKGGANLSARGLFLEFKDAALLAAPEVPPVPGADRDLYGAPLPTGAAPRRPGPFGGQPLPNGGHVRFVLWPLPLAAPDEPNEE